MKIYNRKSLLEGIFFLVIASVNIVVLIGHGRENNIAENIKSLVFVIVGLMVGCVEFYYAFNEKGAREARREQQDERNQLITWKSESLAFRVVMWSMAAFFIGAAILWKCTQSQACLGAIAVIGMLWTYMWILQMVCFIIKERKN